MTKRLTTISQSSSLVFDSILAAGGNQPSFKIDNAPGAFMPVTVEELPPVFMRDFGRCRSWSIAHYFTQNGDAMRDPEMIIYQLPSGQRLAGYYRQDALGIEEVAIFTDSGECVPLLLCNLNQFFNMWMRNIRNQQAL